MTLNAKELTLRLRADVAGNDPAADQDELFAAAETKIAIPWSAPPTTPVKGIVHVPTHNTPMKPCRREALLVGIAKARRWIKDVEHGHSFADIARREGKPERYVRRIARLAFVSPRIITAIMDGTAPAGLTVTAFAAGLPYSWAEQEQRIGIHPHRPISDSPLARAEPSGTSEVRIKDPPLGRALGSPVAPTGADVNAAHAPSQSE